MHFWEYFEWKCYGKLQKLFSQASCCRSSSPPCTSPSTTTGGASSPPAAGRPPSGCSGRSPWRPRRRWSPSTRPDCRPTPSSPVKWSSSSGSGIKSLESIIINQRNNNFKKLYHSLKFHQQNNNSIIQPKLFIIN